MTFVQSIRSGFVQYWTCTGRAARSEFWYWSLFTIVAALPLAAIDYYFIRMPILPDGSGPLENAFFLITLLPSFAVMIRRLHDIDRSGYWWLISLTIIGLIPLIYWWCKRGTPGANRFGADPLA